MLDDMSKSRTSKSPHMLITDELSVLDAYQQRMWEIEMERKADAKWENKPSNTVWDESIAIFDAAKRQILGY